MIPKFHFYFLIFFLNLFSGASVLNRHNLGENDFLKIFLYELCFIALFLNFSRRKEEDQPLVQKVRHQESKSLNIDHILILKVFQDCNIQDFHTLSLFHHQQKSFIYSSQNQSAWDALFHQPKYFQVSNLYKEYHFYVDALLQVQLKRIVT